MFFWPSALQDDSIPQPACEYLAFKGITLGTIAHDPAAELERQRVELEQSDKEIANSKYAAAVKDQILEYVDMLASLRVPEGEPLELGPPEAPEREAGQIPPDPMAHPPGESAPDFREGFFVVPSPPSLGGADDPGGSP